VEKFIATSFFTGDPSFIFPGVNKDKAWYLFGGGVVLLVGRCPTTADRLTEFFRVLVPGTTISFLSFFRLVKSRYNGDSVGDFIINGDDDGDCDDDESFVFDFDLFS